MRLSFSIIATLLLLCQCTILSKHQDNSPPVEGKNCPRERMDEIVIIGQEVYECRNNEWITHGVVSPIWWHWGGCSAGGYQPIVRGSKDQYLVECRNDAGDYDGTNEIWTYCKEGERGKIFEIRKRAKDTEPEYMIFKCEDQVDRAAPDPRDGEDQRLLKEGPFKACKGFAQPKISEDRSSYECP